MSGTGHYRRVFRSKHITAAHRRWANSKLFNRHFRKEIRKGKIKKKRIIKYR